MKRIWAPWRMKFVQTHNKGKCVFCEMLAQDEDADNLILTRGNFNFVVLNRYPYTSGHMMVVANTHMPALDALDAPTRAEMMELAARGIAVLRKVYQPDAFNTGSNMGEAAGAGIAGHVHLHIVPRWNGDTNFMSILADTRILPEGLGETYRRLLAAWDET
jgi:ATP adenylyltransferase